MPLWFIPQFDTQWLPAGVGQWCWVNRVNIYFQVSGALAPLWLVSNIAHRKHFYPLQNDLGMERHHGQPTHLCLWRPLVPARQRMRERFYSPCHWEVNSLPKQQWLPVQAGHLTGRVLRTSPLAMWFTKGRPRGHLNSRIIFCFSADKYTSGYILLGSLTKWSKWIHYQGNIFFDHCISWSYIGLSLYWKFKLEKMISEPSA